MKKNRIRQKLKNASGLVKKRSGPWFRLFFILFLFLLFPANAEKPSSPLSEPVPEKEMDLRFQVQEIRLQSAIKAQDQIIAWQKEKIEELLQARENAEKELSRISLTNSLALERMRENTFRWIILLMMFMVGLDILVLAGGLWASQFLSGKNRSGFEKRLKALEKKSAVRTQKAEKPLQGTKIEAMETPAKKAMENKDWERAAACWKELSNEAPETGSYDFHLGYCLSMASDAKALEEKKELLNRALEVFSRAGQKSEKHLSGLVHWGNALYKQAGLPGVEDAENTLDLLWQAEGKYQSVLALAPRHQEALYRMGVVLTRQARLQAKRDAFQAGLFFHRAGQTYEKLHLLRPKNTEVLNSWGICLSHQARLVTEADADKAAALLERAAAKYEAAVALKPDKHEALYNWGNALSCLAKLFTQKDPDRACGLLELAAKKYEAAVAVKPEKHEALYNWGNALSCLAKLWLFKNEQKSLGLLEEAAQKYQAACATLPDKQEALNNWGLALLDQAKIVGANHPEKAWKTLGAAGEKFKLALNPDCLDEDLLSNWGHVLHARASIAFSRNREMARKLLLRAEEKFRLAEILNPRNPETRSLRGKVFFDLSRLAALTRHREDCRKWLLLAQKAGQLPNFLSLSESSDFHVVKQEAWFQEILDSFRT